MTPAIPHPWVYFDRPVLREESLVRVCSEEECCADEIADELDVDVLLSMFVEDESGKADR